MDIQYYTILCINIKRISPAQFEVPTPLIPKLATGQSPKPAASSSHYQNPQN